MTVIAAAIGSDGEICMGADAVTVAGNAVRIDKHSKVFELGEFLIGGSGTKRASQIMQMLFSPPPINGPLNTYMIRDFVSVLRATMKDHGGESECENDEGGKTALMDADFLITVRGHLFEIDSGYAVVSPEAPYYAIGCARQEAFAGMFTATQLGVTSAREIVEYGLRAAAEFDIKIRPPFSFHATPKT